jgi:hypothetical protein
VIRFSLFSRKFSPTKIKLHLFLHRELGKDSGERAWFAVIAKHYKGLWEI